ncbi:ly-6/neurotoxin-like protein 1 [Cyprinodon tularosa]|uniref:ly-6/neurotoxin-like protein 1 n=1 Tax=Cyprinodon tularosa TaxID=77115 RepID=UPI0018E26076|nr:ly-6/neurotoxin-like protein 1 [Cyprinodon tularosa]
MGKLLFFVVAVVASLAFGESLTCNTCSFDILDVCLSMGTETCAANVTNCQSTSVDFTLFSNFFIKYSCLARNAQCDRYFVGYFLGFEYTIKSACCTEDLCNTFEILNSAPTTKMTFTTAIVGAILASLWGGHI